MPSAVPIRLRNYIQSRFNLSQQQAIMSITARILPNEDLVCTFFCVAYFCSLLIHIWEGKRHNVAARASRNWKNSHHLGVTEHIGCIQSENSRLLSFKSRGGRYSSQSGQARTDWSGWRICSSIWYNQPKQ